MPEISRFYGIKITTMLHYIKKIISVEPYTIVCKFNTGEVREINLQNKIKRLAATSPELFNPLLNKNYFKRVKLDSYGTLCWDNEVDFCPDVLYKLSYPLK